MARTLIISDLHIGARSGNGVLERPPVLQALAAELANFERLILLGDVVELREGRPVAEVMEIARPILAVLGSSVGGSAPEIIFMPGNHDRMLVGPWIRCCGPNLPLEGEVPADSSPLLAEVVELLSSGGTQVTVRYPGYRLSDRIWLHHGHYLDRVISPEGPYGFWKRPTLPHTADYERGRIPTQKPAAVRLTKNHVLHPRFAPLTTALLNWQMRAHSLPALARVLSALGVSSEFVVFGHVHRLGPLPGDRLGQWQHPLDEGGAVTHFINTGSWVEEELLIGDRRPPHPYWPGGAVIINEDGIPHAVELLDIES